MEAAWWMYRNPRIYCTGSEQKFFEIVQGFSMFKMPGHPKWMESWKAKSCPSDSHELGFTMIHIYWKSRSQRNYTRNHQNMCACRHAMTCSIKEGSTMCKGSRQGARRCMQRREHSEWSTPSNISRLAASLNTSFWLGQNDPDWMPWLLNAMSEKKSKKYEASQLIPCSLYLQKQVGMSLVRLLNLVGYPDGAHFCWQHRYLKSSVAAKGFNVSPLKCSICCTWQTLANFQPSAELTTPHLNRSLIARSKRSTQKPKT
jgi:hypothetical protein